MYLSCLLSRGWHYIVPIPSVCALISIHRSPSGGRARPPARTHSIQPIERYALESFPMSSFDTIPMRAPLPLLYVSTYAPHLSQLVRLCIIMRSTCEIRLIARVLHPLSITLGEQEKEQILNHHGLRRGQRKGWPNRNEDRR